MSVTTEFKFHGRREALDIIDTGGDLVGYLGTQSAECPLIGSDIQLVEKLGEGAFGAAFLIKIKGMGTKEYVAKRTDKEANIVEAEISDVTFPATLGDVAEGMQKKYTSSKEVIIALNGGDSRRVIASPQEKILFPEYADMCLTTKEKQYKRLDKKGYVKIPAGSYVCHNIQYSEYIIGVLCGDLYRRGTSANFFDVFGFATCPGKLVYAGRDVAQYVFMERIDKPARAIRKCIFEKSAQFPDKFRKVIPTVLLIQILHAIATYQSVYQIQHNDLHDDNVFVEFIRPGTVFAGQNLADADWFHYKIGGVDLYLPWVPLLAKIGDFGLSVKYSEPIVGDKSSLTYGYDQRDGDGPWVPNWFSVSSDMLFITRIFYKKNPKNTFIKNLMARMLGMRMKNPKPVSVDKVVRSSYRAGGGARPKMDVLGRRDKDTSPVKILTDESLLGEYMVPPTEGKIVTLGVI